jgi:hypothetical protein
MDTQKEYDETLESAVAKLDRLERFRRNVKNALNNQDCRHAYELADTMLDILESTHDMIRRLKNLEQELLEEENEGK